MYSSMHSIHRIMHTAFTRMLHTKEEHARTYNETVWQLMSFHDPHDVSLFNTYVCKLLCVHDLGWYPKVTWQNYFTELVYCMLFYTLYYGIFLHISIIFLTLVQV